MKLNRVLSICMSLSLGVQTAFAQSTVGAPAEVGNTPEVLQTMITQKSILKAGNALFETAGLVQLYAARGNQPIWTKGSTTTAFAGALKEMILKLSIKHGLIASDYWTDEIEAYFSGINASNSTAFELAASDAFIKIASHISNGQIEPTFLDNDVRFHKRNFTEFSVLAEAVAGSTANMSAIVDNLAPEHHYYRDVVKILADLNKIKESGGYAVIKKPTVTLTVGSKNFSVPAIRERLIQQGYSLTGTDDIYDKEMADAVQDLEKENGFDVSATIKPESGLWNVILPSVDFHIAQTQANLEKLRWLPKKLEANYIFANINATEVKVYENNQVIKSFKSINGKVLRRTPMMKVYINRVIFNPKWAATESVVIQDKLPKILLNPNFLKEINMVMIDRATHQEVDPSSVNWRVNSRDIIKKHDFVMGPGPKNALGVFKFPLMPDLNKPDEKNSDDIFMHFTDNPTLFKEYDRHLSSGCVRLEMAEWLAGYLLRSVPGYDPASIRGIVAKGTPNESFRTDFEVKLPPASVIAVYTVPLTVERTASGKARFMRDYYLHDKRIQANIMASNLRSRVTKTSETTGDEVKTGLRVNGERGASQYFSVALASRCEEPTFAIGSRSSSRSATRRCDAPVQIKLNETSELPAGRYLVGFENTIFPGFVNVQSGKITQIQLQKIVVPTQFSRDTTVKIYRDMTSLTEQKKVYFEKFYLGQNLFRQTLRSFGDFYLAGLGDIDVVNSTNYSYCSETNIAGLELSRQIREHAKYICESYNSARTMMDYADLYNFQTNSTYQEAVADQTGDVVPKRHLRYLVAAPVSTSSGFVSVMPGVYRINGEQSKLDTRIQTGSLVESYSSLRRTFGNSKTGVELGDSDVATPPTEGLIAIGINADGTIQTAAPVRPKAPCEDAKMWRTASRSYCVSENQEGCSIRNTQMCQEVRLDLRFRK